MVIPEITTDNIGSLDVDKYEREDDGTSTTEPLLVLKDFKGSKMKKILNELPAYVANEVWHLTCTKIWFQRVECKSCQMAAALGAEGRK